METRHERHSIRKDEAIAYRKTQWWKTKTPREIAMFQMFTNELCCPIDVLQNALEKAIGRSVWTHEFGLNYDGLCDELLGTGKAPSMQEIIDMIPEDKRIIV